MTEGETMSEEAAKKIDESIAECQREYNNVAGNLGHLIIQNLHNEKAAEDLRSQALVLIKKVQNLQANKPKQEPKDEVAA